MVERLVAMQVANFRASGAELVMGEARFTEPKTVAVTLNGGGSRYLRGERVFLGLGSRASVADVPGLIAAEPMTHVEALDRERLPNYLIVLGGGYVGLEFAHAMRRFGRSVTIIQRGKQLAEGKQRHCIRITNDFGAGELTCVGPTHVGQFDRRAQLSVAGNRGPREAVGSEPGR